MRPQITLIDLIPLMVSFAQFEKLAQFAVKIFLLFGQVLNFLDTGLPYRT